MSETKAVDLGQPVEIKGTVWVGIVASLWAADGDVTVLVDWGRSDSWEDAPRVFKLSALSWDAERARWVYTA